MTFRLLFFVMMIVFSTSAASARISESRLVGAVLADSGTISQLQCPVYGDYDCLTWPRYLHKYEGMQSMCFEVVGEYFSYDTAFLVLDKNEDMLLLVRSSLVGDKYEFHEIGTVYQCPSLY